MNDLTAPFTTASESNDADARPAALDRLIQDINAFLVDWVQQLDAEIRSLPTSATCERVSQTRLDEFEQLKQQWEAHRLHEAQLIREQSDHLTAAWLQLEAEQRRFLQLRQESHHPIPSTSAHGQAPQQQTPAVSAIPTRDAAVRQFRQLQQQVGATVSTASFY